MNKTTLSELRTVYIDPDMDDALRAQSTPRTGGRNTLFLRWVEQGMGLAPGHEGELPECTLVMRTMCFPVALDDALRNEAYATKTPRNDLVRRYLRAGMEQACASV